jgi:hypothetical protein
MCSMYIFPILCVLLLSKQALSLAPSILLSELPSVLYKDPQGQRDNIFIIKRSCSNLTSLSRCQGSVHAGPVASTRWRVLNHVGLGHIYKMRSLIQASPGCICDGARVHVVHRSTMVKVKNKLSASTPSFIVNAQYL